MSGFANGNKQIRFTLNGPIRVVAPITGVVLVDLTRATANLTVSGGSVGGSTLRLSFPGTATDGERVLVQLPAGLVSGAGGANANQSLTVTMYTAKPTVTSATVSPAVAASGYVSAAGAAATQWTVRAQAAHGAVASVELQAQDSTTGEWVTFATLTPDSTGKATFTGLGTLPDGQYDAVRAVATDQYGNQGTATVKGITTPFTLDTKAPKETAVALTASNGQLIIFFNEAVAVQGTAQFKVTVNGQSATVSGTVSGNKVLLDVSSLAVSAGDSFTVTYTGPGGLTDLAGNPVASFSAPGTAQP